MSVDNLDPPLHNINLQDNIKRKKNLSLTHKLISSSFRPCGSRELISHGKKDSTKDRSTHSKKSRNILNLPLSSTRKENISQKFGRFPGTDNFLNISEPFKIRESRESEAVDLDNLVRDNQSFPDSRVSDGDFDTNSCISDSYPHSFSDSCISDGDSDSSDSRITDGSDEEPEGQEPEDTEEVPSSKDKWMAAFVAGVLFALISSPLAYYITSSLTVGLGGIALTVGPGPTFAGLLLHTIIFILIVRWILN